ncbi:epidermal retinol dehydrogenase 2-like [Asterias rubens]|uniref:epidermal retinol dehydrogenase 2-like n=1 Tax=Asterias rubens TaxID=7604 RepID=UPI0014550E49|nr:epidermal retinol dehydrogenase 2-like [Asterias rubens]
MAFLKSVMFLLLVMWYCLEVILKSVIPRRLRARKNIAGEIVLITGGGSGMGRLLAVEVAKLHATVVLWDVNESGNAETVDVIRNLGGQALAYTVDVTKSDEVYKAAEVVRREVGEVTVVVNNAGVVAGKPLLECPDHLIRRSMDVNVMAHFWVHKAFLPNMVARNRGHLVTIASLAGFFCFKNMTEYCASKFATVGLHETLRMELAHNDLHGIDMTLVCPAFTDTGMFRGAKFLEPKYVVSKILEGMLLREKMTCIPGSVFWTVLLKYFIPEKLSLLMQRASGLDRSMDTFVGRQNGTTPPRR